MDNPEFHFVSTVAEFRDVIDGERLDKGMSQRSLALTAGAGHATFWAWMKADVARSISLERALAYANALGLRVALIRE